MKKKTAALLIICALVLGIGGGALAASGSETISALLRRDTKVVYNGVEQTFKDAQGNIIYPIAYNGSTYLPVRAVANMMGEQSVNYDGATDTVILGKTEKQPVSLVNQSNSGGTKFSSIINDKDQLKFVGSDATQEFKNGVVWHQWNGMMSTGSDRGVLFDVAGYSTLTFTAAADVRANVNLYDQDDKVIASFTLKPGEIVSKTITLNGATKVALGSNYPGLVLEKGDTTDEGYVFMYEPTLS